MYSSIRNPLTGVEVALSYNSNSFSNSPLSSNRTNSVRETTAELADRALDEVAYSQDDSYSIENSYSSNKIKNNSISNDLQSKNPLSFPKNSVPLRNSFDKNLNLNQNSLSFNTDKSHLSSLLKQSKSQLSLNLSEETTNQIKHNNNNNNNNNTLTKSSTNDFQNSIETSSSISSNATLHLTTEQSPLLTNNSLPNNTNTDYSSNYNTNNFIDQSQYIELGIPPSNNSSKLNPLRLLNKIPFKQKKTVSFPSIQNNNNNNNNNTFDSQNNNNNNNNTFDSQNNNNENKSALLKKIIYDPIKYTPSVILGLLLNILDGLSYGMILFPLGTPLFADLGPVGLSMFYVSCIVSQLVYSLGGSVFKAGIGSEMIEVVPFFHSMAFSIMDKAGKGNPAEHAHEIIATTVASYAFSSIITGMVFFLLGYARLGSLIGFFPRHILVGCIGGVGYFLTATGIEVSARLPGNLEYNWSTLKALIQLDTLFLWTIPLALAVLLMLIESRFHHPLIVPTYFILIFFIFHLVVALIPNFSLPLARDNGWVFYVPTSSQTPWWSFYKLYDFNAVNWSAFFSTIPAMFALTFFGILHVPINVPALAVSIGYDNINVDRELIAHGVSNALSGLLGSIQNYLVYTNSVLFIRSGADSRLAGVMLAIGTFLVMILGSVVINYIPVMVVGALIFLLGFELLKEALYDTYGRLNRLEYFTIIVIILIMGIFDFVYGILAGIILACVSFVVQTSRKSAIRATYTGVQLHSTVRRHILQQRFLKHVGKQTYVIQLTGFLFFGTIVSLEKHMRNLLKENNFANLPIRNLIMDMSNVRGLDYSAAEAFLRMKRLLDLRGVTLILCGVSANSDVGKGLIAVDLWEDDKNEQTCRICHDLNSSLEWSENELLTEIYRQREISRSRLSVSHNRHKNDNSNAQLEPQQQKTLTGHDETQKDSFISSSSLGKSDNQKANVQIFHPKDKNTIVSSHVSSSLSSSVSAQKPVLSDVNSSGIPARTPGTTAATAAAMSALGFTSMSIGAGTPTSKFAWASFDHLSSSPRRMQVQQAVNQTMKETPKHLKLPHSHAHELSHNIESSQPLMLLMQCFYDISFKGEEFWKEIAPYFSKEEYKAGYVLYRAGEPAEAFYVIEKGILRVDYNLEQEGIQRLSESILAGTTCGELPFFGETPRTASVAAERDTIVWKLDKASWRKLQKNPEAAEELLECALRLTSERMNTMFGFAMANAGYNTS